MKQIKVTAKLFDGRLITNDGYLPLDGILYRAKIIKEHPELLNKPVKDPSEFLDIDLPIKKIDSDTKDWYYACSFSIFEKLGENHVSLAKRYDTAFAENYVDFGKRKATTVDTARGKYKNYWFSLPVILTKELLWYLLPRKKEDIEEIKFLLSGTKYIGKKHAQGFGNIKEWVVEEVALEEEMYKLRPIPCQEGYDMAIRPPYFSPFNKRKAIMPDDERLGCNQLYRY